MTSPQSLPKLFSVLAAAAAVPSVSVANYPAEGASGTLEFTRTFYDNYQWRANWGNPLSATYNTGYDSHLQAASNTPWPYGQANSQSLRTRGLVTGTRTRVLVSGTYVYSVNIYDAKRRLIQVQSQNITGSSAVDVTTTQYNWTGQPLATVEKTEKAGTPAQTTVVVTHYTYDDLGRLAKTDKKLSNTLVNSNAMSAFVTTASLEYDALGQLKKKSIGSKKNASNAYITPRQPLQELDHDYNIRGWLLGVNRNYLTTPGQTSDGKLFGFELGYDKLANKASRNFTAQQRNGNISGMIWKSDGDDTRRKYDFTYDAANRLLSADFEQQNADGNWSNSIVNYNVKVGDGIDPSTAYDANGNIKQLQQWGLQFNGSAQVDNLRYTYIPGTNKVKSVTDFNNDPQTKLGDFATAVTHPQFSTKSALTTSGTQTQFEAITDYEYTSWGSLKKDNNKSISNIVYNFLNLPQVITIAGKGEITYTYDATGNKRRKRTIESPTAANGNKTITTTTTYIRGLVFESRTISPADPNRPNYTDKLLFMAHEEGRIRKTESNSFEYDYFVKDHLGNTRMVLTEEQKTNAYPPASMETAQATTEEALYANLPETRYDKSAISGYPTDNYTSPNDYVARVRGDGQKIGPAITLKVMAGDKINIHASSWYKLNGLTPDAPANPLTDLVAALISGVGGAAASAHGGTIINDLGNSGILNPEATGFLNSRSYTTGKPKAYLNWILLDEQFKYVSEGSGFEQVGNNEEFKQHVKSELPVTKNGYLYVYVSNETPNIYVFFDNLQLTHIRGPILEETHYYPFGLTMAGISSKALNNAPENRYKYNKGSELQNKEFSEGSGLDWYATKFRMLDPQIGRWHQIDPKPDYAQSLYSSMGNNPILHNDPLGDTSRPIWLRPSVQERMRSFNNNASNTVQVKGSVGVGVGVGGKVGKVGGEVGASGPQSEVKVNLGGEVSGGASLASAGAKITTPIGEGNAGVSVGNLELKDGKLDGNLVSGGMGVDPSLSASKKVGEGNVTQKLGADAASGDVSLGAKLGLFGISVKVNVIRAANALEDAVGVLIEYTKETIKDKMPSKLGGNITLPQN